MTELRAVRRWGVGLLVAVALLGMPDGARGQTPASSPTPRTFGTVSVVSHTVPAESFGPYDPLFGDTYGVAFNASRFCAIPNCILSAGLQLPAGAVVLFIEVDGCDTNGANNFQVRFVRAPVHNAAITVLATANSSGNPGCVFVTAPLGTPEAIDNFDNQYVLRFESPVGDNSLVLQAVRIGYQLQVSPSPAAATFSDVPTSHPFFRFVEALAASGITSGCGGGNFCPDAPLTRGQMAVFLSIALGLHFAP